MNNLKLCVIKNGIFKDHSVSLLQEKTWLQRWNKWLTLQHSPSLIHQDIKEETPSWTSHENRTWETVFLKNKIWGILGITHSQIRSQAFRTLHLGQKWKSLSQIYVKMRVLFHTGKIFVLVQPLLWFPCSPSSFAESDFTYKQRH